MWEHNRQIDACVALCFCLVLSLIFTHGGQYGVMAGMFVVLAPVCCICICTCCTNANTNLYILSANLSALQITEMLSFLKPDHIYLEEHFGSFLLLTDVTSIYILHNKYYKWQKLFSLHSHTPINSILWIIFKRHTIFTPLLLYRPLYVHEQGSQKPLLTGEYCRYLPKKIKNGEVRVGC